MGKLRLFHFECHLCIFLGPSGLECVCDRWCVKGMDLHLHFQFDTFKRHNILYTKWGNFLITIISHCGNHRTALLPINFILNSFPAHYHISSNCTKPQKQSQCVLGWVFGFWGDSILSIHFGKDSISASF